MENILFVKGACTFDGIAESEVAESEEPNAIFFFYEIAYFSICFFLIYFYLTIWYEC